MIIVASIFSTTVFALFFVTLSFVMYFPMLKALEKINMCERQTSVVIAYCLWMLCLIGLMELVPANKPAEVANLTEKYINFICILLPYAAAALCLIIITLFGFMVRMLKKKRSAGEYGNENINR